MSRCIYRDDPEATNCTKLMAKSSKYGPLCKKHYLYHLYGFCTARHKNQKVPATGSDGLCWKHRTGKMGSRILAVGDINDHGIKIIDGPWPDTNSTRWTVECPYCHDGFLIPTTRFNATKVCYSCRGELLNLGEETELRRMYRGYKNGRRATQLGFSVTYDQFLTIVKRPCHYCGASPQARKGECFASGIDRKDNLIGYHLENLLPCCSICNQAKHVTSYEKFNEWLDRLVEFRSR